jgi:hypothetical protein
MKMATAFMLAARLVSHGVSRKPSRLVITSATPATSTAMPIVPNCMKATTAMPPVTTTGPKYGIELKSPAAIAQTPACSRPSRRKAIQLATPTSRLVNACTNRKRSICCVISPRICTVIFFFDSVGPDTWTSLRLNRSPDMSMKYTRNSTATAWPANARRLVDPHHR